MLALSDPRFHRATGGAMVAPAIATIKADESSWRPGTDERFGVDFLTALHSIDSSNQPVESTQPRCDAPSVQWSCHADHLQLTDINREDPRTRD